MLMDIGGGNVRKLRNHFAAEAMLEAEEVLVDLVEDSSENRVLVVKANRDDLEAVYGHPAIFETFMELNGGFVASCFSSLTN
uniref:Uncharacterized protein n=1 Tax=Chromera velia CCMP2878 TaxID=1169474 RepID=A0A0G4HED8_9ALVE|eukprot:Cvel_6542.t1-p1 / transcript=Cvel_6542.t1 / gene=Cvel_6542 / organism=Chromera_velia_CCMP2878 / gene_product=hypothetical protein / transcript_product=hypothetical protein / location=Cvel_scaffold322:27064-27306(-) / protein_length=81 / sequence_SO=supercontig / SO=protein_coding / is_pseudo=false